VGKESGNVEKGKGVKGGLEVGNRRWEVGNFRPGKGGKESGNVEKGKGVKGGLEVGNRRWEVLDCVKV